jgi:hypothetical protein
MSYLSYLRCSFSGIFMVLPFANTQGLRTAIVAHRHEFKTNHGFRKLFQTNAEPKMKSLCVKTLTGQDTGLAGSYYKPTVEELPEEYLKAVDNLTINQTQANEEVIKNRQALAVILVALLVSTICLF